MSSNESRSIDHLVEGAIDTHIHTKPGAFPRHDSDFSAARKAQSNGMRAIVTKNHHFDTAARAQVAREETGFTVLGGITLNEWVGGLNPITIDGIANFDPSIIWMPTITAANHLEKADISMFEDEEESPEGISILDDTGTVSDDALAVLDRIAEYGFTIGLSHIAPDEGIALVKAATDRGLDDFLVTHPLANFLNYTHDQMREITDLGATLEFHYNCTTEMMGNAATIEDYIDAIDAVGVENAIMATDGGATVNPPAMEMFTSFIHDMLDAGVSEDEIEVMIKENPRDVLSIE